MEEIPEDIQQTATRFAGEYLAHDISCERLYRDVAALLVAERARCAKIILPFTMQGGVGGAYVRKAAWSALDALSSSTRGE